MPHSKLVPALLLVILSAAALCSMAACGRPGAPERLETITLAVTPWPASLPLYVAQEKGYFREEGIEAVFHSYASGHLGLDAALSGRADLATATDTPIARAAVSGMSLAVIATLAEIDRSILIIARKDKGISAPGDLRGKRIGLVAGSSAEYFLHIYLTASYVNPKHVRIVDLPADGLVGALLNGTVDAVSAWPPSTTLLLEKLADKALILHDPNIYRMTWNIAAARSYIEKNPEKVKKFLRALLKANARIERHPEESAAVFAKYAAMNRPLPEKEWGNYRFILTLDQALILNLEDQARWIIKREDVRGQVIPNFLDYIYMEGLKSVQPRGRRNHRKTG